MSTVTSQPAVNGMLHSQAPARSLPKSRVELHIHFTSTVRLETLWELIRRKNHPLPGRGTLQDLRNQVVVKEPKNLEHYLMHKKLVEETLSGDLEAIERVAFELAEEQAREGVLYTEVRIIPRDLLPRTRSEKNYDEEEEKEREEGAKVTVDSIVQAALKGIKRGEEHFGVKIRIIFSCVRQKPEWAWETLRLCEKYKHEGVVGIDLVGSEGQEEEDASLVRDPVIREVFRAAATRGIHRTVHSGEAGPASCVRYAMEMLEAERIGHGYRVMEDEELFAECLARGVHFEVCPHSSLLTGALLHFPWPRHPLLRLVENEASFSLSSDNPALTDSRLTQEYRLVTHWGLTEADLTRANFQAALHSFLPADEKVGLIAKLKEAYGIINIPCVSMPHFNHPSTTA